MMVAVSVGLPAVDDAFIVNRFLLLYSADAESGESGSLQHYQARFPDHADLIRAEYERLRASADPEVEEPAGQDIGRYRLRRALGRGGQGVVHLADDRRLGRRVALKVLHGSVSAETLARFEREAKITSRLDDPGICTVYETGLADGAPFIAMRYIAGDSLASLLERARAADGDLELPPDEVTGQEESGSAPAADRGRIHRIVRFVERTARSLHTAHEAGIVHRDIKPGNIMVGTDGPVILDFGMARAKDQSLATLTRPGDVFGTPAYMSPEQIASGALDRRSDVYSLGVVLYECLTLRRPFEAPTREGLYEAIRFDAPVDPRALEPGISPDLGTIVGVALAKDPDRRYRTALDLAEDLRRWRTGEPVLARPPTRLYRMAKFAQRHRGLVLGTAAVIAVLVLGVVGTGLGLLRARDAAAAARAQQATAEETLAFFERMLITPAPGELGRDARMVEVLDSSAAELWNSFEEQPEVRGSLHVVIGRAYKRLGELDEARRHVDAGHATLERLFGADDVRTVRALAARVMVYWEKSLLTDTEQLARRALDVIERNGWENRFPVETVDLTTNLALAMKDLGLLEEAAPLFEDAYERANRLLEPWHEIRLSTMNNLARLSAATGDLVRAEELMLRVVELRREHLGHENPKTYVSIDGLAWILHQRGRCGEADRLFDEAHVGFVRVVGERHLRTAQSMILRGRCWLDQGRLAEAGDLFRSAHGIVAAISGPGHLEAVHARYRLATALLGQGLTVEGEAECRGALEDARALPRGHHLRVYLCCSLGRSLRAQGRGADAERELSEALRETVEACGEDHALARVLRDELARR